MWKRIRRFFRWLFQGAVFQRMFCPECDVEMQRHAGTMIVSCTQDPYWLDGPPRIECPSCKQRERFCYQSDIDEEDDE